MDDKKILNGETAIITGSNRGIGKAVVKRFAEEGANIYACARRESEEFTEFVKELEDEHSVKIKPVYFDLLDYDAVKVGITEIIKDSDKINILVNNAGIAEGSPFLLTSIDVLKKCFEVNYFAQIFIMQLVARRMIRQKYGSIINMASVSGLEHRPGHLSYGSSKAALIWATQMAAKELGGYGIRVNAVAPAMVDTDMGHYRSEKEIDRILSDTPLKRMALPDEIADAVLFLASEQSSFITGDIFRIDGGRF